MVVCQVCQGMNWKDCSGYFNSNVTKMCNFLEDDSVTRFVRKLDLSFEISDRSDKIAISGVFRGGSWAMAPLWQKNQF